jgi:AraC-like DNA-binding protein
MFAGVFQPPGFFVLGFEYQTYFNRFFKKHCGVTPSEYRRSIKINFATNILVGMFVALCRKRRKQER